MKPHTSLRFIALAMLAACAPAKTVTEKPTPVPAPTATTPAPTTPPPAATPAPARGEPLAEAPRDWQLLDESTDHIAGISARRAERELLAGKPPKKTVVVAIIDSGIDTAHVEPQGEPLDESEGDRRQRQGRRQQRLRRRRPRVELHRREGRQGRAVGHVRGDATVRALHEARRRRRRLASCRSLTTRRCKRASREFEKARSRTRQMSQQIQQISVVMTRANEILASRAAVPTR